MDLNTPDPNPAQRWSRLASARVRERAPIHDRGSPKTAAAPTKPATAEKQPVIATPTVAVQASRYPSLQLAATMLGHTVKALERKIERGIWAEGKHFYRRDGRIYIDMQAVEAWVCTGR